MKQLYTQQNYQNINNIIYLNIREFIFYLVVAILVGYLIHYVFSHRRDYVRTPKKRPGFYYNDTLNTLYYPNSEPLYPQNISQKYPVTQKPIYVKKEKIQYKQYQQINDNEASKQKYHTHKNDLKIIEGIGPKIEEILNKAGVKTWYDLSKKTYQELRGILDQAGQQFKIHDPKTWPEQAHLAEMKQWEKLQLLQDYLHGGRYLKK